MKIIKIIAVSITVFIVMIPFIDRIPIKHVVMQIDITKGPKMELVEGETTQIYVGSYPESPGWYVYGKNGIKFDFAKDSKMDNIFITGNFPNKLNHDLIENTFVLNGKYIGKKKRKDVIAGCFYVESWGILEKIKRRSGYCENFSNSSLTIMDNEFADPILVYDLEEFEDVDE